MHVDRAFPPFPFLVSAAVGTAIGWHLFGVNKYYITFFATIIATMAAGFVANRAPVQSLAFFALQVAAPRRLRLDLSRSSQPL
jgi:hypothetical protein